MHPRFRSVTLALVLLCAALVIAAVEDITGTWKASFETQIGQQNYTYTFEVKDNGETEIKDGKVEGDTVTFVENLNFQGMDIRIEYTGKIVSADEIRFTRKVADFATEELVATRVK